MSFLISYYFHPQNNYFTKVNKQVKGLRNSDNKAFMADVTNSPRCIFASEIISNIFQLRKILYSRDSVHFADNTSQLLCKYEEDKGDEMGWQLLRVIKKMKHMKLR